MATTDLDSLVEMGFPRDKAELAVKESGNLQGAIEWLEKYQDKTLDEILAGREKTAADGAEQQDETVRSYICGICGKQLRNQDQVQFHAIKTEHDDFRQSNEELTPLTAEEIKARMETAKLRLAEKRAQKEEEDKEARKRNEAIRRKHTKETDDIKEELQKKQQVKEAEAKRREKQDEIAAKQRIRAKIEADKQERRLKAEKEKAEREGRLPQAGGSATSIPATQPAVSKPASAYTETRLRLQLPTGNIQKVFPIDTTLFEVASSLEQESGQVVQTFTQNFPRKVFDTSDFGQTLKEAGLVPSAALIVR